MRAVLNVRAGAKDRDRRAAQSSATRLIKTRDHRPWPATSPETPSDTESDQKRALLRLDVDFGPLHHRVSRPSSMSSGAKPQRAVYMRTRRSSSGGGVGGRNSRARNKTDLPHPSVNGGHHDAGPAAQGLAIVAGLRHVIFGSSPHDG